MSPMEMFCRTASCRGFWGITVHWDPGDATCPPYPAIDYCPHCKADIYEEQLPYENAIAGLLDALDESDTGIDPHPLLVAIQTNLEEQRAILAARLKAAPPVLIGPEERCPA